MPLSEFKRFVPFSELGKKAPNQDVSEIIEFQTYIFEHKPCMVILNETWLSKCHLDNEIFPDGCYECYRLDRSVKTHPPDKNDPKKFKLNGGGVLIAIRSDLEIEHKNFLIDSKAEIISVQLNFATNNNKNNYVCVSTCYRVGTLA